MGVYYFRADEGPIATVPKCHSLNECKVPVGTCLGVVAGVSHIHHVKKRICAATHSQTDKCGPDANLYLEVAPIVRPLGGLVKLWWLGVGKV